MYQAKNYGKIVSGPLTAAFALHGRAYIELGNAYRDLDYGKLKRVLEKDVKFYQQVCLMGCGRGGVQSLIGCVHAGPKLRPFDERVRVDPGEAVDQSEGDVCQDGSAEPRRED